MDKAEARGKGRPKGRLGRPWQAYVSFHAIDVLEKAAGRRKIKPGKYLDEIVAVLEGFMERDGSE